VSVDWTADEARAIRDGLSAWLAARPDEVTDSAGI
jgi:hypothetical protein